MKKILIIRNAFSFDFGGGERIPVELAVQFKNLGHDPVVVSRSDKLLGYANSKNIPTIKGWWWSSQVWSGLRKILFPVYIVWSAILALWYISLVLRTRADVVGPQSRDDFIAATIAAKLLNRPVVWTDHADLKYIYRNAAKWYKNPIGYITYKLSKKVDAVVIVSHNELTHIEENLGHKAPDNYVVIHNGVSSGVVIPTHRRKDDEDAVIFAATSRLIGTKGIAELIRAFQIVNKANMNTRLWLFGEGPEEEQYIAKSRGNKNIIFWGFPDDTLSRLASADVFVHPSYHEGFSVSLIEAAKLGLPIIACDVGGNPEIVRQNENGLLIKPRDDKELAEAMNKLLLDEGLRKRLGKSARKIYEDEFVFEKIVIDKVAPLYEK